MELEATVKMCECISTNKARNWWVFLDCLVSL